MKSIIVEGCDGSGKDTLIDKLMSLPWGYRLHERASTSLGGPVSHLGDWVIRDAPAMNRRRPYIYNRHPLISEPIYAPVRKVNPGLSGEWTSPEWIAEWRRIVGSQSVLVICQPPFRAVANTVKAQGPEAHMPGVAENIRRIYLSYNRLVWPGTTLRYDYTFDLFPTLVSVLHKLVREK